MKFENLGQIIKYLRISIIRYFNYTKYKSDDDMFKRMNNEEKYPLIKQFIVGNPEVKNLSYLLPFNEFTNYR